ncbi:P-loop NTPase [Umezawaea tangerina]|uniref:Iron-sulfur cluster carrier protein n=1 Tax=Umezawaea tangerina TaxID=84725 RepID=A0A2T0SVU7_9PSEU|nr:P-loop NTPase [Umezawaea tangerina]PRY37519.1 NUBPL iron-transfer P-loop NTPase [Umezawaea tangerina]
MSALLPGVRVVMVCGGKGGVGKSTVAANLATALAARGTRTGLLDADLHGPSLPVLFGVRERPTVRDGRIRPVVREGVRLMSTGLLADASRALAWKGPVLRGALRQMVRDVDWGDVETLVVDTPPGTSEIHMALAGLLDISAAVVVTTPQRMALEDTRRCVAMLTRLGVAIPAVVENMAYFPCPCCGARTEPFPDSGLVGALLAETGGAGTRLVELPLLPAVAAGAEQGTPFAQHAGGDSSAAGAAFASLLDALDDSLHPVP